MRIEPSEKPIAWFGDGTEAIIERSIENFDTNEKGEPITLLILRPTDYFKEKNDIKNNELIDGTITAPIGHTDWRDVVKNAKTRAKAMEERIQRKLNMPMYAHLRPKEAKKIGKKSA